MTLHSQSTRKKRVIGCENVNIDWSDESPSLFFGDPIVPYRKNFWRYWIIVWHCWVWRKVVILLSYLPSSARRWSNSANLVVVCNIYPRDWSHHDWVQYSLHLYFPVYFVTWTEGTAVWQQEMDYISEIIETKSEKIFVFTPQPQVHVNFECAIFK